VPGQPGVFAYGFIPPGLFQQIKAKFLELTRRKKTEAIRRLSQSDRRKPPTHRGLS
jgi:hypothetical protein